MTDERLTDSLTSLMRGEMTAVETYELAIDNLMATAPEFARMLHRIRDDHAAAVEWFRSQIVLAEGEPPERSGPWGVFAQVLASAASLASAEAAAKVLLRGEQQGLVGYDGMLDGPTLDTATRDHVATQLRPQVQGHIAMLEAFRDHGTVHEAGLPAATPAHPAIVAILEDGEATMEQKVDRLQRLSYAAREHEVATEEGMAGRRAGPSVQEIDAVLTSLGADLVMTDGKH